MPDSMKIYFKAIICLIVSTLVCFWVGAQTNTISGSIRNSVTNENVSAVSIQIKNSNFGTYSDDKGNFKIKNIKSFPVTLVFSSIGFVSREVVVPGNDRSVQVSLQPGAGITVDVVVAASRVPERILESPVSIERVNLAAIRN